MSPLLTGVACSWARMSPLLPRPIGAKKLPKWPPPPEWKEELKKQGVLNEYKDSKGFYAHLKEELTDYTDSYKELKPHGG